MHLSAFNYFRRPLTTQWYCRQIKRVNIFEMLVLAEKVSILMKPLNAPEKNVR